MSNLRLSKARSLLQQAKALHNQIQENIRTRSFGNDDICMKTYNDLTAAAANLFPEDPILNGQMVIMPDAVTQTRDWADFLKFPEVPSQRTDQHLIRLINRLEMLLGEEPTQQPLDERDFSFVADQKLRKVLTSDFIEAQRAFIAETYKACGLLCGGLIEGMLLDIVQSRSDQPINWDRVSMTDLIKMSTGLSLVSNPVLKFAEGARDIRDTVHPRAEVRQGSRASRDEAEILLQLVKLIYNDLIERLNEGENE